MEVNSQKYISEHIIQNILSIYLPEHRYVTDAYVDNISLLCNLRPTRYPYTEKQLFKYITSPTANLLACQMAYVLIAGMAVQKHPDASCISSLEHFCLLRDKALLRFGRFIIRFREEVANVWPISGSMIMTRKRKIFGHDHCIMDYKIGNGISGEICAAIMDQ